ncbi:DMT family transporter [uncultured Psychromonas sp.]|uniref:DMT family transporter n=1 Tax=uncultured Psychromonas sp. TaxID=173974 RepID=UPI0026219523|nr:EamA family transporter [uncultured Psychromonas sp.]
MNILLAMAAAFFWGTTYAVTQYSLEGWPPLLLGAIRALPAGLLLLLIKPSLPKGKDWVVLLRLGAINIALFFGLLFIMAQTLPSAISAMGMVYVPVFAMCFHWLVNKKKPAKLQLMSGALLVILAWQLFDPQKLQLNSVGLVAMLTAIGCIVIGSNLTQSLSNRIHWWTVLSWQLILGGSLLAILAALQATVYPAQYINAISNINSLNILGLSWLILLNTALAYGLYVWLLSRMTVVEFTFAGVSNPIAGILMGLLLMGESFNLHQYSLMAAIILTSLLSPLFANYRQRKTLNSAQVSTLSTVK